MIILKNVISFTIRHDFLHKMSRGEIIPLFITNPVHWFTFLESAREDESNDTKIIVLWQILKKLVSGNIWFHNYGPYMVQTVNKIFHVYPKYKLLYMFAISLPRRIEWCQNYLHNSNIKEVSISQRIIFIYIVFRGQIRK